MCGKGQVCVSGNQGRRNSLTPLPCWMVKAWSGLCPQRLLWGIYSVRLGVVLSGLPSSPRPGEALVGSMSAVASQGWFMLHKGVLSQNLTTGCRSPGPGGWERTRRHQLLDWTAVWREHGMLWFPGSSFKDQLDRTRWPYWSLRNVSWPRTAGTWVVGTGQGQEELGGTEATQTAGPSRTRCK